MNQSKESWDISLLCPGSSIIGVPPCAPSIVFDAVYAKAVFNKFVSPEAKTEITSRWQSTFYPERAVPSVVGGAGPLVVLLKVGVGVLGVVRFIGIPVGQLPKMLKKREEKAKAVEFGRIEDKVHWQQWKGTLSPVSDL